MRSIFSQDVVIYTADSRNVHCVTEVHFCFLHYLNVSFIFIGYLDAYQLCRELLTVNCELAPFHDL
jgi:hypothetical protein